MRREGWLRREDVSLLILVLAGLATSILTWIFSPGFFAWGWLAAMFTLLAWPLGSMGLLLTNSLTGGRWIEAIRLPLLLGTAMLPLALLAAVPVGLFLSTLYPWMHEGVAQTLSNRWYLNGPFLAGRTALYVVVWGGLAALTLLGAFGRGPALRRIAPLGLILLVYTVTWASFDLTLSLEPTFSSSVYGMLVCTGMVLFALSVSVLLAVPGSAGEARDQLGKLLLTLCILWTYLDFVQTLIIWSSNLHSDAPWLSRRWEGFWGWSLGATDLLHSFAALILLGIPRFRKIDGLVFGFAALLVLSGIVRAWWLVLPGIKVNPQWMDLTSMAGLGATAVGLVLLVERLPVFVRERARG